MHSSGLQIEPVTGGACHTDPIMTGRREKYDPRKAEDLLLIVPLNQPGPIQMERHFGIHRLHRSLLLERNWRLEHISLRQIKLNLA